MVNEALVSVFPSAPSLSSPAPLSVCKIRPMGLIFRLVISAFGFSVVSSP